jgi:ribosomal protein S20
MPVTSAARKAHSRSLKLRDRNYTVKTAMKTTLKSIKKLASAGKPLVQSQLQESYSKIDKALKV